MKTTTTTREYDAEGRLLKETISEIVTPDAPVVPAWVAPICNCGANLGSHHCPQHGWVYRGWSQTTTRPILTCGSMTSAASGRITINSAALS